MNLFKRIANYFRIETHEYHSSTIENRQMTLEERIAFEKAMDLMNQASDELGKIFRKKI